VVVAQEHRVAVGRGGLQRLGRQLPAGPRLVLDDDGGAAQLVLQAFGQDAGDGIGAAAGRKAHQHAQAAAGLGARQGPAGRQRGRDAGAQQRTAGGRLRQHLDACPSGASGVAL
jgi:hypothetical protein